MIRRMASKQSVITNNEQNKAAYAQELQDAIPPNGVFKYLSPSTNENLTAWTVTDGDAVHVCPPVWCVHMAGPDPKNCLETVHAFLDKAILNKGQWSHLPNTKTLG